MKMDTVFTGFNANGLGQFLYKMDWAFQIGPPDFIDEFKRTSLFAHPYTH